MRKEHSQHKQKEHYTNNRRVKPGTLLRIAAKNHILCCTVLLQYTITYNTYLESHIQHIMFFLLLLFLFYFCPASSPTIRLVAKPSRFSSLLISAQCRSARLISIRDAHSEKGVIQYLRDTQALPWLCRKVDFYPCQLK